MGFWFFFFSWFDRLELVKSILFPKFLFLFQTLLVEITLDTLRRWQALFTSFIWKNKRSRIGFHQLNKPSLGGFGLLDLRFYYLAAQVWPIYSFLTSDSLDGWRFCEQRAVAPCAIQDVIWCNRSERPDGVDSNPYLALSLRVWDFCRKILAPGTSPMSSFLGQKWFLPTRAPGSFEGWRAHGLTRLHDISSRGVLMSKYNLEEKSECVIPWFEFLQVQYLFGTLSFHSVLNRDLTTFELLLCNLDMNLRGFISICYRSLKASSWSQSMTFQKAWEQDCQIVDGSRLWPLIWSSPPLFRSKSLSIKLQFVKTVVRWYITPRNLSLFSKAVTPYCWKGCGQIGTLLHCLWSCPLITSC